MASWFSQTLDLAGRQLVDISELSPAPNGRGVAFIGTTQSTLAARPERRLYVVDVLSGAVRRIPVDRQVHGSASWSPDGRALAVLAEEAEGSETYQPWVAPAAAHGRSRCVTQLDGSAEYVEWSTDGSRLLVGVAPDGVDHAGASGSGTIGTPHIGRAAAPNRWVATVHLETGSWTQLSSPDLNVWEATWCGPHEVALLISDEASENSWYVARVVCIDTRSSAFQTLYEPESYAQIGDLTASKDGRWVAFIEGPCSDRGLVAGDVRLVDRTSRSTRLVRADLDATSIARIDDSRLALAGLRGPLNVMCDLDIASTRVDDLWQGHEFTGGGRRFPLVVSGGARLFSLHERLNMSCRLVELTGGAPRTLFKIKSSIQSPILQRATARWIVWRSSDGAEIPGLLSLPSVTPRALLVWLHGGPVSVSSDQWKGRPTALSYLLAQNIAILRPNPRGSVGSGRESLSELIGDVGGVDAEDVLAGVDYVHSRVFGRALPTAVGGESYGGYLSAWLLTRSELFRAAVVSSPITHWSTFAANSNISRFAETFAAGPASRRNPLEYADRIRTPTLIVTGALDRCTPPDEGRQLYEAMTAAERAPARLIEYPHIGHVPRAFPALLHYTQQISDWLDRYLLAAD